MRPLWQRLIPLAVLALGLVLFFSLGFHRYLSLESLRVHRAELLAYVDARPFASAAVYVLLYVGVVAFGIPGGTFLTIAGGFLFGTVEAAALASLCATFGGTILFLATRTALAEWFRAHMGPRLIRFEDGFNEGAFSYIFALRLIPMFPFPIVNIAAGLLGVNPRTFVTATLFGIIPATVVFAGLGSGLGVLFDEGAAPDLNLLFEPRIFFPLIGLAILAVIPPVWRAVSARRVR